MMRGEAGALFEMLYTVADHVHSYVTTVSHCLHREAELQSLKSQRKFVTFTYFKFLAREMCHIAAKPLLSMETQ